MNKKFVPIRKVIFRNLMITEIALFIVTLLVINIILPYCFYLNQKEINKDISVSINENISEILYDLNRVYSKLSADNEMTENIKKYNEARAKNDYNMMRQLYYKVSPRLGNTVFCNENLIRNIGIMSDGETIIKYGDMHGLEEYTDEKLSGKPTFIRVKTDDVGEYYLVMPFYDKIGQHICDIFFQLSKNNCKMIDKQVRFAVLDNSGAVIMSNKEETVPNKQMSEILKSENEVMGYSHVKRINGKSYFTVLSKVENFGWYLCVMLPIDGFYKCIRRLCVLSAFIMLIMFIAVWKLSDSFSSYTSYIGNEIGRNVRELNNFLNIKGESENENVKRSRREIGMFKGKSVYSEFLTYNIASAVVPMIIILTVINSYYRTIMVREYENSVNILAEMNKFKIENIFGKYSNALKYILTDENIKENIYKYSTLKDSGDNGAYKYYDKANNELKKLFSQIGDFRFIYQNNGGAIAAQWMDGMEKTKDAVSFSDEFVMFFDSAEREYICSIGKRLSLSSDNYFKKIGYCTLQFGCGGLIKDISALYSGSFFEIVNENRIIASSTDKYNIGKRADNNDEYIIKNFPLDKYKAEIRIHSSKEPMKRILFICTMIFFAVICLILSAVCVISYGISNYIAEPVISTRYALINDFNVEIKRKHRDEFEELKEAVDEMKQRIKKLINEVYEHEILEKDLQMEALRAQIQPHFLYNVFEVINAMIDLEDDRVSELIILLSDFFRNGISIDKTEITLEDEIKYSNIYLDIQKFILGDRLSVTEHIDERCLNKPIIRFVIQPILENAFKHGVFRKNKKIKIKINVLYVKNGKMKIYISDNGAGMDEELRLKLIEYINGRSTDFKGVGLKNINERLILHYGKEYGLKIHSKVNKGSIFVITIPCD